MKSIIHVNALLYVGVLSFNIFSSCSSTKGSLRMGSDVLHPTGSASALIDLPSGVTHSILAINGTTMLQPVGMDLATQSRILSAIDPRSTKPWVNRGWATGYNIYVLRDGKKYFPPFDDMPTQMPRRYRSSKRGSTTVPTVAEEGAAIRTTSIASFNDEISEKFGGGGHWKWRDSHWDYDDEIDDEMWDTEIETAGITSAPSIATAKPIPATSRSTKITTEGATIRTSSIASFNDEMTEMLGGSGQQRTDVYLDFDFGQYDKIWDTETEATGITSTPSIATSKPIATTSRSTRPTASTTTTAPAVKHRSWWSSLWSWIG